MILTEGEGFAAYAIYNAIHLHFTSKSYDYFKYSGKTNVSKDSFLKRKDKYKFYKLSRKYSLEQLKDFFVANFIENDVNWVGELDGELGETTYKKWIKRRDSLTYTFQNDLDCIFEKVSKPDDIIRITSSHYPKLLTITMSGDICLETTCILNDLLKFMSMWDKKIDDDIVWPNWKMKLERYSPFINYDKNKFKHILKEYLDGRF
jgi:T4 gene Gp59 loader of gp41 DNA helicase/T4 gene Gp59 loader of gp41 DNA helicase C-term